MKFFAALKQAEFAQKLFASAGLNFEALFAKGDEHALKAHLESLKPAGDITALNAKIATLTEETTTLNAALASAKTEFEAAVADRDTAKAFAKEADAKATLITTSLAAAGVKLPVATADKPVDQAAIQGALDARISTKAREQLAKHGINDPLPVEASADAAAKPAPAKGLSGLAKAEAALAAKLNAAGPN